MVDKELNNLMSLIPTALRKALIERLITLVPDNRKIIDSRSSAHVGKSNFIIAESVPEFITSVCRDLFNQDIRLVSRKRDVVEVRQAAIWIIKKSAGHKLTWAYLGKYFGNKNHATMIHSFETCESLMVTSPVYLKKVAYICTELADRGYLDPMVEFIKFLDENRKDFPKNVVISPSVTEILKHEGLIQIEDDTNVIEHS